MTRRFYLHRARLGQHFLKDAGFCQRIADSLSIEPDDLVVEIGAGQGALTRFLAPRARHLVAVEIDPAFAAKLRDEFLGNARVEILGEDILKVELAALARERHFNACFVFGNLPYYITSPILRHLFDARAAIRRMTLLMQREVAERVTAAPGSRAYGYLSVLVQCYSEPRAVLTIPPGAFSPSPQVHSVLVDFPMASRFPGWAAGDYAAFLSFAQLCFRQKRKSLVNNLSHVPPQPRVGRGGFMPPFSGWRGKPAATSPPETEAVLSHKYSRLGVQQALAGRSLTASVRAEQLSLAELAELFQALELE